MGKGTGERMGEGTGEVMEDEKIGGRGDRMGERVKK